MQHVTMAEKLLSVLDGYGIRVSPREKWIHTIASIPTEITLNRGESSQTYTALYPRLESGGGLLIDLVSEKLRPENGERLLAVADRLNARTMTAYRNRGIDYIDLAGNALIQFDNVYVDVQGRTLETPASTGTRLAPVNLFSPRRAQVIFALLVWPKLLSLPIKHTSEVAGVSMGMAFEAIQLLKESGYVMGENTPRLARKTELIDRWADAYGTGLRNKLILGRYRADNVDAFILNTNEQWLVSGEAAVGSLLRPTTLTIYVDELDPKLIFENRWRRDGQPNIEVRKKFWKNIGQILHAHNGSNFRGPEGKVPPLLIYADLIASGDGRQREAAQQFRKENYGFVDS